MSKISRLCLVSAAALPCAFLCLRKRRQSEHCAKWRRDRMGATLFSRAEEACLLCRAQVKNVLWTFVSSKDKALREDGNESRSPLRYRNNSQDCSFISRPFPNAKIARINDMANFFEQKMSLFPLLKKRGSLWWQKRLSWVKKWMWGLGSRKAFFWLMSLA